MPGTSSWPALEFSFTLPDTILVRDRAPKLGWWDADHLMWRTDGIESVTYNRKSHVVTFQTLHVAPTAVIQVPSASGWVWVLGWVWVGAGGVVVAGSDQLLVVDRSD